MSNPQFPAIDLKKILNGAQLPALPQSAIRLLELSQDPANGPVALGVLRIEAADGEPGSGDRRGAQEEGRRGIVAGNPANFLASSAPRALRSALASFAVSER